jgi:hypothetical protein
MPGGKQSIHEHRLVRAVKTANTKMDDTWRQVISLVPGDDDRSCARMRRDLRNVLDFRGITQAIFHCAIVHSSLPVW